MNERNILELKNLSVGYGKTPLLHEVCLQVQKGKIVTLIGPNGAGKSTILKTITRQLKIMGGSVLIQAFDMRNMTGNQIARKVSMVMTERPRPELMTCREVVGTGRYPYVGKLGILTSDDWKKVDLAIHRMHAEDISEKFFHEISDGQKQRILLARAICQDTDILILDEPTTYLDMKYKLELIEILRELVDKMKMAVVLSMHELDLAMKFSDIVACVDENTISSVGTPEMILSEKIVGKLYGIEQQNFNVYTGSLYLTGKKEKPRYFVIGGGGAAIPLYYKLQRERIPFAVGIIQQNDVEYDLASAYASRVIHTKPFYPIEKEEIDLAKRLIDECEICICAVKEFGPLNEANQLLWEYAKKQKKQEKLTVDLNSYRIQS